MITQAQLKEVLRYDPDTGLFTWIKSTANKIKVGDVAGSVRVLPSGKSYKFIGYNYVLYSHHRLVWLYMTGQLPPDEIDHINGDGTDNRWCNLRAVNTHNNRRNLKLMSNNSSGCCGVSWSQTHRAWRVRISTSKNVRRCVGLFDNLADAIRARKDAEVEYNYHENHGSVRSL